MCSLPGVTASGQVSTGRRETFWIWPTGRMTRDRFVERRTTVVSSRSRGLGTGRYTG